MGELDRFLPFALSEEKRRPEPPHAAPDHGGIIGAPLVLDTGDSRCPRRHPLRLGAEFVAAPIQVSVWADIAWLDVARSTGAADNRQVGQHHPVKALQDFPLPRLQNCVAGMPRHLLNYNHVSVME